MAKRGSSRKNPSKGNAASADDGQVISSDDRQRLIAETAYFRAMQRGFNGGDPIDDWLSAEREINRRLPIPQQQKQERAAYGKLRDGVSRILADTRETLSTDTIRGALDRAVTQLKQLGEYTTETIDKVEASVEMDMVVAAQKIGPRWEAFSEKTADLFHVWQDRNQQYLTRAAQTLGDWLRETGGRQKQHIYRTGEMIASGTLVCTKCHESIVLETSAHLPSCPKCRNLEFKRI